MHDDLSCSAVRAEGLCVAGVDLKIGAASGALQGNDAGCTGKLAIHIAARESLLSIDVVLEYRQRFSFSVTPSVSSAMR